MTTIRRYQVKKLTGEWDDRGPDLLRTEDNAVEQARDFLPDTGPWHVRRRTRNGFTSWKEVGNRQEVSVYLDATLPKLLDRQTIQIGRASLTGPGVDARVVLRANVINVTSIANATDRANLTHALIRHRFPQINFVGCFVCKRFNGSTDPSVGFSDHAWGDALDEAEHPEAGIHNDEVFDWCLRMAREDLMSVEQVIGSRRGRAVVAEAPGWVVTDYDGGPGKDPGNTHLWHVHLSCVQHEGIPPCAR